jgi:branched-chain amino acid transport system substrate-binding protein
MKALASPFTASVSSPTHAAYRSERQRPATPMHRWRSIVTAFALVALVVGGCAKPETAATGPVQQGDENRTIVIGMLAPLTGAGARFGESQRNGVQLALDEINAAGGIDGRRLQLVVEDTKTEPPTAVTAFTRLAERSEVAALFGSAASLDVPAYLPQVDRAGIPHLLPVAVLPSITQAGSKFTFRSALNDRIAAEKMAEFVVNQLGARKVALLIEDSAFGETGLMFAREAQRLGVTPLTVERLKRGDVDVKPQLTKIRSTGATHIQFWGYYAEYALVAKQLRELGYPATLMGNQAPVNDKTLELGGPAMEGALNVCLFVPTAKLPRIQSFVSAYRQRFAAAPDTWAAQSYDGMRLLADAIRRGGTTRKGIRDALAATTDFDGVTGRISFMESGDAAFRGTSVVKVAGGTFVPFDQRTE